jgi:hypothetical protein
MSTLLDTEVSADALAALTNMSRRWVFDRATDGTIRAGRGKFRLGDALPALIEHIAGGEIDEELQRARLRKLNADGARAEHALDVERGKYVLVSAVNYGWQNMMLALQRVLMNVPERAVRQLLNEKSETVWKQKLRAELISALEQNRDHFLNATKEELFHDYDETADD